MKIVNNNRVLAGQKSEKIFGVFLLSASIQAMNNLKDSLYKQALHLGRQRENPLKSRNPGFLVTTYVFRKDLSLI